MQSAVCTLFEGHYHYGLAGLTNSLFKNGYRGAVYAGYRGALPEWAGKAADNPALFWIGAKTLQLPEGLQIHFLPVETDFHLTNYKPYFMSKLTSGPAIDAPGLLYFDPDIVIKCQWGFYERWISQGVALVHEITANDMPATHPIRKEWEAVIAKCGKTVTHVLNSYINGGFCGVSKRDYEFIKVWADVIDVAAKDFGFEVSQFSLADNRTNIFYAHDQDALNIAAMCCNSPISEMGPEGMDFTYGGFTMSHAIGSPKPWKKEFLKSAMKGIGPSMADKEFWLNTSYPIPCYPNKLNKKKKRSISAASFISRFYKKS